MAVDHRYSFLKKPHVPAKTEVTTEFAHSKVMSPLTRICAKMEMVSLRSGSQDNNAALLHLKNCLQTITDIVDGTNILTASPEEHRTDGGYKP